MATRKKAPPEEEFFELPSRAQVDIEDFMEEWAPQSSIVEIYRRKEDGSLPHIKRVGIEILRADLYGYLREKFGNGKYHLQFKDASRKFVKSIMVDVEGAPAFLPNPNGNGSSNGTFLEQLLLTMIAAQKPAPPVDMGALMTGLGTMLQALKPNTSDPAAMLTAMATTFQQLKPPDDNVDKALTIISKAKDIAGDGGGGGDTWPGVIKEGLSAVTQVFATRGANGNPARPAIPPGAVATPMTLTTNDPATLDPQPAPVEKSPDVILQEWLQTQIAFLKTKARAGKDPDFWVEYIFDNAEEPGCAAILEALRRGATYQHLLTLDPEIGKDPVLANWFRQLYEALRSEFDADVDSPGGSGDAPDPGSDAKPGPA